MNIFALILFNMILISKCFVLEQCRYWHRLLLINRSCRRRLTGRPAAVYGDGVCVNVLFYSSVGIGTGCCSLIVAVDGGSPADRRLCTVTVYVIAVRYVYRPTPLITSRKDNSSLRLVQQQCEWLKRSTKSIQRSPSFVYRMKSVYNSACLRVLQRQPLKITSKSEVFSVCFTVQLRWCCRLLQNWLPI